jgi:hypothetical protein
MTHQDCITISVKVVRNGVVKRGSVRLHINAPTGEVYDAFEDLSFLLGYRNTMEDYFKE